MERQSRQIPSVPDLFIRPASIVFGTEFHLQSTVFILRRFKILESPNFATKDIFFLSMKLILIQLHAGRSFYDE